jgi:glycosyltransferase involved in cell wall biosynthesis
MKSKIISIIPVYNGAEFIGRTLKSVAAQTLKPDRVIILDNCSTDNTVEIVKGFASQGFELRRNEKNIGPWANWNLGLDYADQTEYLHMIAADDLIKPTFFERLIPDMESCRGLGMVYSLDERIDEHDQPLGLSGKVTGATEVQTMQDFLKEKAEISNQTIGATILKTAGQKTHCLWHNLFPMLPDSVFWVEWGKRCEKIVRVHEALCQYRWHYANGSGEFVDQVDRLVVDEWRLMQWAEEMRGAKPDFLRQFKLKGIFAARSAIKAKRVRQNGNLDYSRKITDTARGISGPVAWTIARGLVEVRDVMLYKLGNRKRHPRNIYG